MKFQKDIIAVYDHGDQIGTLNLEEATNGTMMQLIKVNFCNEPVMVLYVDGMDYGIIIPTDIAEELNQASNGGAE